MIATQIVPILVISGVATAGLILMAVAPRQLARLLFGIQTMDVFTIFLARYAGLLVFIIGCLIVYSAFHPEVRTPVLAAAITEKVFFITFVFLGRIKRTPLMLAAVIIDGCFVLLYLAYLSQL